MTNARALTNHLAELLRRERHAMADFLLALAAFDRARAWEQLGHASLFAFLRVELGLSAGAAQYRKTAAEIVQTYPDVEEALRTGRLCLSSVIELAKVITPQNAAEILPRFFGRSSREAAQVAVSIRPVENPPVREVVTTLRPAAAPAIPDPGMLQLTSGEGRLRAVVAEHPRRREARGVEARWRALRVAARVRRRLRLHAAARARPRHAARARRAVDDRQREGPLQVPQRPRGASDVR